MSFRPGLGPQMASTPSAGHSLLPAPTVCLVSALLACSDALAFLARG